MYDACFSNLKPYLSKNIRWDPENINIKSKKVKLSQKSFTRNLGQSFLRTNQLADIRFFKIGKNLSFDKLIRRY